MNKTLSIFGLLFIFTSCSNKRQNPTVSNTLTAHNTEISSTLPTTKDTINLSFQHLKTIPYLRNIKYLNLSNNNIQSLDFTTLLIDSNNQFHHSELEYLDLSNNNIDTGLFLFKTYWFPKLKYLNLSNNKIPYFFEIGYDSLSYLDLSNNDLHTLRTNSYIDTLNISNNSNLIGEQVIDIGLINKLVDSRQDTLSISFVTQITETKNVSKLIKQNISDSIQLEEYAKMSLCSEDEISVCKLLNYKQIETINQFDENRLSAFPNNVHYGPDSTLKIFEVMIEDCGMYCNSASEHIMHYNLDSKAQIVGIDLQEIKNIYKLPDNKYLILHEGSQRVASVRSECYYVATLISFNKDSLIYHEIPKPNFNRGLKYHIEKEELFFAKGNLLENNSFINYNSETHTLAYSVANDLYWCCNIDSAYIFEGSYQYKKGQFILIDESKTITKINW